MKAVLDNTSPEVLKILQRYGVKDGDLPNCVRELTAAMSPPAANLNSETRGRLSKFYEQRRDQFRSAGVTKDRFLNGFAHAEKRGLSVEEYAKGA